MIRIRAWIDWALRCWWIAPVAILLVAFVLAVGLLGLHEECPSELVVAVCAFVLGAFGIGLVGLRRRRPAGLGRVSRADGQRAPPTGLTLAPFAAPGFTPGVSPLRL